MAGESSGAGVAAAAIQKKKNTRPIFRRVAGSNPGPRVSGALGFPVPGGGFLLFGGYLEEEGGQGSGGGSVRRSATNETWRLSKDLASWERVSTTCPTSPRPRARLAAAGAVASGSAWLLGGWDPGNKGDGGEILSDIWRYDLESGVWSEAKLRQPDDGEEVEGKGGSGSESGAAAASVTTAAAAAASSAPFLPPPPETAVALPPGGDPSAFASAVAAGAAEQEELPESIVLPSLPACSRAAAAAVGGENGGDSKTIALFTHRNGGDILLFDASDVSSPVLRACVVAGDEEAARNRGERAFDGSTALPASRGLSALASFRRSAPASPPATSSAPASAPSSSLHLFGGAPKSGPMLDDSWFLELAPGWEARLRGGGSGGGGGGGGNREAGQGPTLRWSRQTSSSSSSSPFSSSSPSPSCSPPPRCSHAVGVLSDESLYLFGGACYDPAAGLLPLGDLWRLDLQSREWEEVAAPAAASSPSSSGDSSTSPSPRNAAAFGVVDLPGGGKGLLIHGGWDPFRKTHDDTWLLTEEEEE